MISNEPEDMPEDEPVTFNPTSQGPRFPEDVLPDPAERREATPGATRPLEPLPVRDMFSLPLAEYHALVQERDLLRVDKQNLQAVVGAGQAENRRLVEVNKQSLVEAHKSALEIRRLTAKVNELQGRNDNQKTMLQSRQVRLETAESAVEELRAQAKRDMQTVAHLRAFASEMKGLRSYLLNTKNSSELRMRVAQQIGKFLAELEDVEYHGVGRAVEFPNSEDLIFRPTSETKDHWEQTFVGFNAKPKGMEPTSATHPLEEWWMEQAKAEVEPLIKKAQEYGGSGRAVDLIEIGRALERSGVKVPRTSDPEDTRAGLGTPTDAEYSELGIFMYLTGKFGRWQAAVADGRQVSQDTIDDMGIYLRMVARIREAGGWPS